jgi:hypothetical protein
MAFYLLVPNFFVKKGIYKKSISMKNQLNEEINQIKYLLNYNRGLTLSEQNSNSLINEDTAPGGLGGNWNPSTGEYTIVKGDTLSKIGKAFGVKWMDIWEENKDTLRSGQPNCGRYCGYNWIFVGEVVTIPGKVETITTTTTNDEPVDNTSDDTTLDDTTDNTVVVPPVVVPSGSEEEKTKKEIKPDCKEEAKKQGLKRFTKERRDFMKKCKAEGGVNAESDEENTPAEDEMTGKKRRKTKRDCRDEARSKNLKGKERREFMRNCKAEGGVDSEVPQETTNVGQSVNIPSSFNLSDKERKLGLLNVVPQKIINDFEKEQTKNDGSEIGVSRSMDENTAKIESFGSAREKLSKKYNNNILSGTITLKEYKQKDGNIWTYVRLLSKPENV